MKADIRDIMTALYDAPLAAVVRSERKAREVWLEWLRDVRELQPNRSLEEILAAAPVFTVGGRVELSITCKVTDIVKHEGDVSAGLKLSVFETSGRYGFSSEHAAETTLTARTVFDIEYRRVKLEEYLAMAGQGPETIDDAIEILSKRS
ncbi:MAG: hypothetical protein DRP90_02250 [Planctomycetota bacterium]|nr:MAG: hypothetical protein DRP90_02250 [Planctomycetota bacterium]